uniref:Uncharacterized protein n=1 Tax=viral metagenome TaxID=1070528 RepID=A0A6C0DWS7_9ZZZZ
MTITNKLVANIKQTNVDINSFINTNNVICIDTCNNRIGINTKTPRYSIDISGSDGKISVNNIEIRKDAIFSTLSGNIIKCISGSFNYLDVCFINVTNISGSLIRGTTISGTYILGICGNILDLSSRNIIISNHLDVSTISAKTITTEILITPKYAALIADFSNINITNNTTTNSLIATTISSNFIRCISANIQTLSAEYVRSNNLQSANGFNYFTPSGDEFTLNAGLGLSNELFITNAIGIIFSSNQGNINGDRVTVGQQASIRNCDISKCFIDECSMNRCIINSLLNVNKIRFVGSERELTIPEFTLANNTPGNLARKTFQNINSQNINSLSFRNDFSWSYIFPITHYATSVLKNQSSTSLLTYKINTNPTLSPNYRYIPIEFKTINAKQTKTNLFFIGSSITKSNSSLDICYTTLNNGIYEINASVTLSYTNVISNDVEPNDYTFGLYNKDILEDNTLTNHNNIDTSYNYIKNKNIILAFDNSYNFSSVALNYIGPLYESLSPNSNVSTYRRGICFLINSQDISNLKVENFTSTIKLLNFED